MLDALLKPRQMGSLFRAVRSSSSSLPNEDAPPPIRQSRIYHGREQSSRMPSRIGKDSNTKGVASFSPGFG